VLWDQAPFASFRQFQTALGRVATSWEQAGRLSQQERRAVEAAAAKAARELQA
jgi:hypothetical protein